jgi:hypothetical protein
VAFFLIFPVRSAALIPLLEFDDYRMIGIGLPLAGNHEIQAPRSQWKLVFEHDAMVQQVSVLEYPRHGPQGVLP